MNARTSMKPRTSAAVLCGALLAATSLGASAQTSATLSDGNPIPATLMPTLSVTASASNPGAGQSWRLSSAKPVRVTLMPVLNVGIDTDSMAATTLPTVTVLAGIEQAQPARTEFVSVAVLPLDNSFLLAE